MRDSPDDRPVENPFAAPGVAAVTVDERRFGDHEVKVCGRYLVVGQEAILPDRCVVDNLPADASLRRSVSFRWAPSFRLALAYSRCRMSFAIGKACRRRQRRVAAIGSVLGLLFTFLTLAFWQPVMPVWLGVVVNVVLFVTLWMRCFESPLRLVHVSEGQFWIRGCGSDFLNQCAQEFGIFEGDRPQIYPRP